MYFLQVSGNLMVILNVVKITQKLWLSSFVPRAYDQAFTILFLSLRLTRYLEYKEEEEAFSE